MTMPVPGPERDAAGSGNSLPGQGLSAGESAYGDCGIFCVTGDSSGKNYRERPFECEIDSLSRGMYNRSVRLVDVGWGPFTARSAATDTGPFGRLP